MSEMKRLLEDMLAQIAEDAGCEEEFVSDTYFDAIDHGYSHVGAIESVKAAVALLN